LEVFLFHLRMERRARISVLRKVLKVVDINFVQISDLHHTAIVRDVLVDRKNVSRLVKMRKEIRRYFHSDMLSCLHMNSTEKQKNPGICMVRQLLKTISVKMVPRCLSIGYDKRSGKKLVKRYYILIPHS
jgi:hypothetical protein